MKKFILPKGKAILLTSLFVFIAFFAQSQQTLTSIGGWNAYVHLPDDYGSTTQTYPALIFAPGVGEIGTDASKLLVYGPAKMIADGIWNGNTTLNNVTTKFIVISVQPTDAYPQPVTVSQILDLIVAAYRVDQNRLICTGLSMGGFTWENYSIDPSHPAYANRITAMIPMSGVLPNFALTEFRRFAQAGAKMWAFQGVNDDSRMMGPIVDTMNKYSPGSSIYTGYTDGGGGHCCWNDFYVPSYRQVINGQSLNIYEWASLQFKNQTPGANVPPVVNAGTDVTITLPASTVSLTGKVSDADGTIASMLWKQVSGPSQSTIQNATTVNPTMSNLVLGTYSFDLTAKDDKGASGSAQVNVNIVTQVTGNKSPVATPGADVTITLPLSSVTMHGTASDTDGTVMSGAWTQVSGPSQSTIQNSTTATPLISKLVQGAYVFNLMVKDDKGATGNKAVNITVLAGTGSNQPPVSYAGPDVTVILPTSQVTMDGSATDADGTTISGIWTQVSGPSKSTIQDATSANPVISNLVQGTYIFDLTVKDARGAIGSSQVNVNVLAAGTSYTPYFNPMSSVSAFIVENKPNIDSSKTLLVFPNPVQNVLTIRYFSAKMEKIKSMIFDIKGQLVMKTEFVKDQLLLEKQVNVSNLKAGSYYVTMISENGTQTSSKLIKN